MKRRDFFKKMVVGVPVGALCLAQSQAAEATPANEPHQFVPQKCTQTQPGVFVYEKFTWVEGLTFTGQYLTIRADIRVIFHGCTFINCGDVCHGPNVTFNSCTTRQDSGLPSTRRELDSCHLAWGAMIEYPEFAKPEHREHYLRLLRADRRTQRAVNQRSRRL